jgi:hypothetical protein
MISTHNVAGFPMISCKLHDEIVRVMERKIIDRDARINELERAMNLDPSVVSSKFYAGHFLTVQPAGDRHARVTIERRDNDFTTSIEITVPRRQLVDYVNRTKQGD